MFDLCAWDDLELCISKREAVRSLGFIKVLMCWSFGFAFILVAQDLKS